MLRANEAEFLAGLAETISSTAKKHNYALASKQDYAGHQAGLGSCACAKREMMFTG